MIDLTINEQQLQKTIQRVKEQNIIIPTFQQQIHPEQIPEKIASKLSNVGLWEVNPLNLFRISWKNEPKEIGGIFGGVNYMEVPPTLTGVKARIFALVGY